MRLEDYFQKGKVYVWKETFAVVKSKRHLPDAFAVIQDKNEVTVVIDQSKVTNQDIIEVERDWKILTFDMVLPFGLVGFLAVVSSTLAEEEISIFAISAYSTDHILVKQKHLARAVKKLRALGCIIEEK